MKYIFFDIYGTLLSHTEGISPKTIEALRLLKENGHKIFICTGRSYAEIPKIIYQFDFDGLIAAAGGYVRVNDEIIYNKIMPEHLVDNIIYKLNEVDIPYVLEGIDEVYSHDDALYVNDQRAKEMLKIKNKTGYEHAAYDYRIDRNKSVADYFNERKDISKMTFYGYGPSSYKEIEAFIDKDFYLIKYEKYAELVAKGVNKFTGIQKILEYFGADVKDTVAIGDSLNDLDMVKHANIGIAVGNASEELKKHADYITDDIHDDGIYNAMKHFDFI